MADAPAAPATTTPALKNPRRMPRMQELGLVIVTLMLSLFIWMAAGSVPVKDGKNKDLQDRAGHVIQENKFLRTKNLIPSVFTVMSWMAIMAIGQTIVVISGGIDISVGSIMGLSAMVTAAVLEGPNHEEGGRVIFDGFTWLPHAPPFLHGVLSMPAAGLVLGIVVPLAVGLICGLINGALVVGLRMHPFIVSLATLSIFRWISLKIGDSLESSLPWGDNMLAPTFTNDFVAYVTPYTRYGGQVVEKLQPVPFLIMLLCLGIGWVYLRLMVWGRETYAVGGNEEAARYSGVRVPWVKMRVYAICGLCAGIAGMLNCGFYKSASTEAGTGYELTVIAATVVGGASLLGGRGTALGAILGMLVLTLVEDGISVLQKINFGLFTVNVDKKDTKLIYGMAIILAVAIDQFSMYLSRRSERQRTTGP